MNPVTDEDPPLDSGWYPDPLNSDRIRYFDGRAWTDEVEPTAGTPASNPDPQSHHHGGASAERVANTVGTLGRSRPSTAFIFGVVVLVAISLVATVLLFVISSKSGPDADGVESNSQVENNSQCVPLPTLSRYRSEWTAAPRGYAGFEEKSQASLALAEATVGLDPTLSDAAATYAEALAGASNAWAADEGLTDWIGYVSKTQGLLEDAIDKANVCN